MSTPLERLRRLATPHPRCYHHKEPWTVPVDPRDLQLLLRVAEIQWDLIKHEHYTQTANVETLEKTWEKLEK